MSDKEENTLDPAPVQQEFSFGETDIQDGKLFGTFSSMDEVRDALVNGTKTEAPAEPQSEGDDEGGAPEGSGTEGGPPKLEIPEAPEGNQKAQDFTEYFKEYEESGGLSEDSYTALETQGYPREMIDGYIRGQIALRDQAATQVAQSVGGREVVDKALNWASKNMAKAEQDAFNAAMKTASPEAATLLLQGLVAKSGVTRNGVSPSTSPALGANPYPNESAWREAMQSPEYNRSTEYRLQVERRLKASMQAGTIR